MKSLVASFLSAWPNEIRHLSGTILSEAARGTRKARWTPLPRPGVVFCGGTSLGVT